MPSTKVRPNNSAQNLSFGPASNICMHACMHACIRPTERSEACSERSTEGHDSKLQLHLVKKEARDPREAPGPPVTSRDSRALPQGPPGCSAGQ